MNPFEESINNYLDEIASTLKKQRLPENIPEGVVELYIVLDREGYVLCSNVIKGDNKILIDFVNEILHKNSPYGEFPEDYLGTYVDIILPFIFKSCNN